MGCNNLDRTLVFSIALNGYQALYRRHFASHRRYAKTHRYEYCCVSRPVISLLGLECAWLKIALILRALEEGFAWVMFVDADAEIHTDTPPIQVLNEPGKSVFMANGFSGRFNSGVIIIKNSRQSREFFARVLAHAETPVPPQDNIGWGENGHLIYLARSSRCIKRIDQRWNNNSRAGLKDYIRHFSRGPLYRHFHPTAAEHLLFSLCRYSVAIGKRLQTFCLRRGLLRPTPGLRERICQLANDSCRYYPVFGTRHHTSLRVLS